MAKIVSSKLAEVDAYIAKAQPFAKPVLEYLRDVLHEGAPGVVEEIKWSRPFFVYQGVILGNISAFKEHCSFGLWGTEIAGAVREGGDAQVVGMGTFGRITDLKDLPSKKKLLGYVKLAAGSIDDGVRTKAWSRPRVAKAEPEMPETLALALKKSGLTAKFASMTPGCRREYCQWIAEAKRQETRDQRATTAVEWISGGKSRNWQYERKA